MPHSRILVRTIPKTAPAWKDAIPQDEKQIYFTGISRAFRTETDARNAAREDARRQILLYYGQYIKNISTESQNIQSNAGDVLNPYIERVDEFTSFAEAVVKQINAGHYYTEVFFNEKGGEEFIVYALCQINRERAEQEINTFAERVSARYRSLLDAEHAKNTLTGRLEALQTVRTALLKNPLERAVALYQTEQGTPNLYDYCALMLSSLSGNITITMEGGAAQPITIKKGDDFTATIKITSPDADLIGAARCKVLVMGADAAGMPYEIPEAVYTIGHDNSFVMTIHTKKFFAGNYNVYIEMLLNKYAEDIKQNPEYGFSFTVFSGISREENPLLLPAGEHWEGSINYTFNGTSCTDVYALLFDESGMCRVALKQDSVSKRTGNGTWRISGEILEIDCALPAAVTVPKHIVKWSSFCTWDASKNSFSLLVPPYTGASNTRLVFSRAVNAWHRQLDN